MTKLSKTENQHRLDNAIKAFKRLVDNNINKIFGVMLTPNTLKLFVANQQNEITEITKRAAHLTGMQYIEKTEAIMLKGTGYNKVDAACDEINHAISKHLLTEVKFKCERL